MADAAPTVTQVLEHSAWHFYFFPLLGAVAPGQRALPLLNLLDSAGFEACGRAAAEMEDSASASGSGEAREPLTGASAGVPSESGAMPSSSSVQGSLLALSGAAGECGLLHHFLAAAAEGLGGDGGGGGTLADALRRAAEKEKDSARGVAALDDPLRGVMAAVVESASSPSSSTTAAATSRASGAPLFAAAAPRQDERGDSARRGAWATARLYGFLCVVLCGRRPGLAARLLALHVACGGAVADTLLARWLQIAAPAAKEARGAAGKDAAHVLTRASGVVCGVLEAALALGTRYAAAVARQAVAAVLLQPDAPFSDAPAAAALYPTLDDAGVSGLTAVRVLEQLISGCRTLDQDGAEAGLAGSAAGPAVCAAVVDAAQQALFALTAGGVPPPHSSSTVAAAAARALTLAEADLLVLHVLPRLLGVVGLEWPWSGLLRRARELDRLPGAPPPPPCVRWTSRHWVDTLLSALAPRHYKARLTAALPGSFQAALAELHLEGDTAPSSSAAATGGDGRDDAEGAAAGGGPGAPAVFTLSEYYREPAEAVARALAAPGVTAAEVEAALTAGAQCSLVMIRLRAHQREGEAGEGDAMLAPDTVAALGARYEAEVLLAAVVAQSQLRTGGRAQELLRLCAPLLERRLAAVAAGPAVALIAGDAEDGTLGFSREARVLLGPVGYQFYTLEWLLPLANRHAAALGPSPSSASSAGPQLPPYSLFAAVAQQFGVTLLMAPTGSSGAAAAQRLPGGPRSAVAVPPRVDEAAAAAAGEAPAERRRRWLAAERYVGRLLLPCLLAPRAPSAEVEGPVAVARTTLRRGRTSVMEAVLRDARPTSEQLAARLRQIARVQGGAPAAAEAEALAALALQMGAASYTAGVLEARDVLLVVAQAFLPSTATLSAAARAAAAAAAAARRPAKRQRREGEGDEEEEDEEKASVSAPAAFVEALWEESRRWWAEATAPRALLSAVSVRSAEMHQQQQHHAGAGGGGWAAVFNSGTLDCSPTARAVLRAVPLRVLGKLRRRAELLAQYQRQFCPRRSGNSGNGTSSVGGAAAGEREEEEEPPFMSAFRMDNQLLVSQLREWNGLLTLLGIAGTSAADGALVSSAADSAAGAGAAAAPAQGPLAFTKASELIWKSPYFELEL